MNYMEKSNNLYNASNFHIRQVYTGVNKDGELHNLQKDILNSIENALPGMNVNQEKAYESNCVKYKNKLKERENKLAELRKDSKYAKMNDEEIVKEAKLKAISKPKLKKFNMPSKEEPFLEYRFLDAYFKYVNNIDYKSLPSQTNQAVMQKLYDDWSSFFESIKDYKANPSKYKGIPRIPGYKTPGDLNEVIFTNQSCKIRDDNGKKYLIFPLTKVKLNLSKYHLNITGTLKQVRAQKYYNYIKLELVYEKAAPSAFVEVPKRAAVIDLGLNNLMTIVTNTYKQPLIINGKPLKSINKNYNQKRSIIYSQIREGCDPKEGTYDNDALVKIDFKRNTKIKDYCHKCTNKAVSYIKENKIEVVYVGKNQGWKNIVNMYIAEKQSFKSIPYNLIISQLEHKLKNIGVKLYVVEESYTSKASAIDGDYIPTYGIDDNKANFSGKRVKRGLYLTQKNIKINADVNAAYNILRKHFDKELILNYMVLLTPIKWTPAFAKKKNYNKKKRYKFVFNIKKYLFNIANYYTTDNSNNLNVA